MPHETAVAASVLRSCRGRSACTGHAITLWLLESVIKLPCMQIMQLRVKHPAMRLQASCTCTHLAEHAWHGTHQGVDSGRVGRLAMALAAIER